MKSNRIFEITTILLNKGTITARELASRFGVSTRTCFGTRKQKTADGG
ncbi:HTH domain-containing protein [Pelosinus baikalensis]|uniref:HTH domain-containing protein n=1 Tax=Pelosinus baikalensis TaxID=2892015 RepID=A0ABS8HYQ4_9FIRM|nr:HTH domain-containing protein [Pelosinus baikalensis]MCC5468270.1 HTH domain-containing protein [Pelosinus baikalensis]